MRKRIQAVKTMRNSLLAKRRRKLKTRLGAYTQTVPDNFIRLDEAEIHEVAHMAIKVMTDIESRQPLHGLNAVQAKLLLHVILLPPPILLFVVFFNLRFNLATGLMAVTLSPCVGLVYMLIVRAVCLSYRRRFVAEGRRSAK